MKQRLLLFTALLLFLSGGGALAQQSYLAKGQVLDAQMVPVAGVAVLEKGTTNGTDTDANGFFELTVKSSSSVLVFSSLSFVTREIPASGAARVVLQEDAQFLQEVIIIGYGQVKKEDATGAVQAIKADAINRVQALSPADLLLGKSAGVQITSATGSPGASSSIRIRGGSSLSASNDPLYVIDGVPIAGDGISGMNNPLSLVNPNDIETFTVLKDASSTAIYGSRASNGVIIITTKRGTGKKINVSYDGNVGISMRANSVDVLDAKQFRSFIEQYHGADSKAYGLLGTADTDWQSEVFRTAITTDHNISVFGSPKALPYRASVGYTYQEGILSMTDLNRISGALSLSPKFFKEHLSVNANAKGIHYINNFGDDGAVGGAVTHDPTQPVYWKGDNIPYHGSAKGGYHTWLGGDGNPNTEAATNPVALLNQKYNQSTVNWFIGNLQLDYKMHFLPELRANLNVAYDYLKSEGNVTIPAGTDAAYHQAGKDGLGLYNDYSQIKKNELLEFMLNYNKEFASIGSRLDVIGGYSWQHFYKEGESLELADGKRDLVRQNTSYKTENFLVSFYGRLNFSFQDRYLLTASLRYDGTSRFKDHWGLFPAVALGWRINKERFMQNAQSVSDLKLRLSYGVTGQQELSDNNYPYLPIYKESEGTAMYPFGDEYIGTLRPGGYDAGLKWEETITYNVGFDYGFLKDRIYGSVDAYYRKTNDLINFIPVAAGTNLTNYLTTNVGNLENKGVEFSINAKPVSTQRVLWDVGFNFTWSETKINKLTVSEDPNYKGVMVGGISGGVDNKVQIHRVGYAPNTFYLYEQVYDQNGKPIEGLYVDQDGDGIINSNDLIAKYKPAPDFYFGLRSTLTVGKLDFSFSLRANLGNYMYNNVLSNNEPLSMIYVNNFLHNIPARALTTRFDKTQYFSNYYVEDASFIRCDNITVGYNFDFKSAGKLRAYLTAQNPFVITNYSGLDPEIFNGIDNNIYPRPFILVLGLNYNF